MADRTKQWEQSRSKNGKITAMVRRGLCTQLVKPQGSKISRDQAPMWCRPQCSRISGGNYTKPAGPLSSQIYGGTCLNAAGVPAGAQRRKPPHQGRKVLNHPKAMQDPYAKLFGALAVTSCGKPTPHVAGPRPLKMAHGTTTTRRVLVGLKAADAAASRHWVLSCPKAVETLSAKSGGPRL